MELFPFLGGKKLNDFVWPNPFNSSGIFDVTKGIDDRQIVGLLGARFKYSEAMAAKLSNTTVSTLHNFEAQLVRLDTGSLTVTDVIAGRPLFWVSKTNFTVTPVASATAEFAGISLVTLTSANAKGDIFMIGVAGNIPCKLKAALTKASPLANDPAVINVTASLGTIDVLADATGWTNVQMALRAGWVISALNSLDGTVVTINIDNAKRVYRDGVQ